MAAGRKLKNRWWQVLSEVYTMKNQIIIKVKDQQGNLYDLDCPVDMGLTLKDICKAYELPMEAMCGGMAMCATCHCYIIDNGDHLPQKSNVEYALLGESFNTRENSRLACQIPLSEELDGLFIELADE